ncbi:MAG: L,D-transpeptidase family protein [Microbacterium sp.]|uniref:L,D-transpeptidase family protein n=1 Tax=Microbacterium sp. TaxID=51671 RepID=UPI0039E4DB3F
MSDQTPTPPTADAADPATSADAPDAPTSADAPVYAWAPVEPKPRKKHLGLWLGIPGGVLAVAAVATSLVLIAPGTAVAGVTIGGMTAGAAAEALTSRLAATTIQLATSDGEVTLTGAELGATIDADALAQQAYAQHPMWNLAQWNAEPLTATVTLDAATAEQALQDADPEAYADAADAAVSFDAASASYVVSPATDGQGIDLETVRSAVESAFNAGPATTISVGDETVAVAADVTTDEATQAAATLNGMLDVGGFYVGDERTVPIDRATLASWLTVSVADGSLTLSADADAIQATVDTLPGLVNRDAVNATVVTNSAGTVLETLDDGQNGLALGDTSGIADAFAARLAAGDAEYPLSVTETAFTTTTEYRHIDVNLTTQTATLYANDQVVQSYTISSGLSPNVTPTGDFTVFAHVRVQDMGAACTDPSRTDSYCTRNVPYVTYFAPDIAFHGASAFRSALGFPQSHGCVNMWNDDAEFVYNWAPTGTEVSVHY